MIIHRFRSVYLLPLLLSLALAAPALAQQPQQPAAAAPAVPDVQPLAFADFSWLNGNCRQTESVLDSKYFTGEFRVDTNYIYDFNHPKYNSIAGSTEVQRAQEVQVEQLGIGGDFHWNNVRGRLLTQIGLYSTSTPRNDASPTRGQWNLDNAYRYVSEAYGGYHFDVGKYGVNVDAGIFM